MPSPRELKVHTESIMKGAVFKKKLEEEREFLKRQELHLQPQQNPSELGVGNRRDDIELQRSLSMDFQSPTKNPTMSRNTPPGKFSFVPTATMLEKMAKNSVGTPGAAANVVDNLNDQAKSWLPRNDAFERPDTQKGKLVYIILFDFNKFT